MSVVGCRFSVVLEFGGLEDWRIGGLEDWRIGVFGPEPNRIVYVKGDQPEPWKALS